MDNCSYIWIANYRQGAITTLKIPYGSFANFCNNGNAKAAVLPLPV